jgi:hypothetical protein
MVVLCLDSIPCMQRLWAKCDELFFALGRSLLDMDFDIDISDQELGIKDMGMVYTSPLRTPPAPSVESTPPASFGLLVVQHMFGSFDKHEMVCDFVSLPHAQELDGDDRADVCEGESVD